MTADVKAQAEALLNGITPGEWRTYAHIDGTALYSARTPQPHERFTEDEEPVHLIAENMGSVDAELCRNAPTLARQVVELAEEVQRLRGLLTRVLPLSIPGGTLCRMCHQRLSPTRPHGPDCPVPAIEAALATQEARHDD